MDRRTFIIAGTAALLPVSPTFAQACAGHGRFIGDLDLRALPDGRKMKLLKPYGYVDAAGLAWNVPEGIELDGASIPPAFWSITGGPWDGPYRNASVIHDWYCVSHSRRWQDVHRMFHEAMLANCTPSAKAAVMFAAVWIGGPRWAAPDPLNALLSTRMEVRASQFALSEGGDQSYPAPRPEMSVEAFRDLAARIARDNLGPRDIEAIAAG